MFAVVPYCQIMTQLGLKDSSPNLHSNSVIGFFSTFNTPCMCPNIRCDGWKVFVFGTKLGLKMHPMKEKLLENLKKIWATPQILYRQAVVLQWVLPRYLGRWDPYTHSNHLPSHGHDHVCFNVFPYNTFSVGQWTKKIFDEIDNSVIC